MILENLPTFETHKVFTTSQYVTCIDDLISSDVLDPPKKTFII